MINDCMTCNGTGRIENSKTCHDCQGHGCCSTDPAEALAEGCPYCPVAPEPSANDITDESEMDLSDNPDRENGWRSSAPGPDWYKRRSPGV